MQNPDILSKEQNQSEVSAFELLYRYATGLKRFWALILIMIGLGGCLGFGYSFMAYKPQYIARSTFTVTADVAVTQSYYSSSTARQLSKTFPNVLTSSLLLNVVKDDLGVDKLNEQVTVSFIEDTNMFTLEVISPTSQGAYNVLSSIMRNYHQVTKYVIGNSKLNPVTEPVVSEEPVNSVEYRKYTLLGAAFGLMIGFIMLSIFAYNYSYIHRPEDVEEIIKLPLLGEIIEEKKTRDSRSHSGLITHNGTSMKFEESVYYMRNAVLRELEDNGLKSLIVTSTHGGEGSSTTAVNLALALCSKNLNVILIDADMRRPSISHICGEDKPAYTLNEIADGTIDWKTAVSRLPGERLDVIYAERAKNASDIISSDSVRTLINDLEREYDIVIIDTPPCANISDARSLAISADALLYVISRETSRISDIEYSIEGFTASGIKIIGCVFNKSKSDIVNSRKNIDENKKLQKKPR